MVNSEVAAMVAKGVRAKRAILKRTEKSDDYKDAAEFEARVARELTNPTGDYMPLCIPDDCDFHDRHNCRECRLMHARFAVEAEMDK